MVVGSHTVEEGVSAARRAETESSHNDTGPAYIYSRLIKSKVLAERNRYTKLNPRSVLPQRSEASVLPKAVYHARQKLATLSDLKAIMGTRDPTWPTMGPTSYSTSIAELMLARFAHRTGQWLEVGQHAWLASCFMPSMIVRRTHGVGWSLVMGVVSGVSAMLWPVTRIEDGLGGWCDGMRVKEAIALKDIVWSAVTDLSLWEAIPVKYTSSFAHTILTGGQLAPEPQIALVRDNRWSVPTPRPLIKVLAEMAFGQLPHSTLKKMASHEGWANVIFDSFAVTLVKCIMVVLSCSEERAIELAGQRLEQEEESIAEDMPELLEYFDHDDQQELKKDQKGVQTRKAVRQTFSEDLKKHAAKSAEARPRAKARAKEARKVMKSVRYPTSQMPLEDITQELAQRHAPPGVRLHPSNRCGFRTQYIRDIYGRRF